MRALYSTKSYREVSVGLYISVCLCLFMSVFGCRSLFLALSFVFRLLRMEHIISIISFLFIIWSMINTSSTYNISFMYLHSLYNNTRVTCSSALSGHPSSSFFARCKFCSVHTLLGSCPNRNVEAMSGVCMLRGPVVSCERVHPERSMQHWLWRGLGWRRRQYNFGGSIYLTAAAHFWAQFDCILLTSKIS